MGLCGFSSHGEPRSLTGRVWTWEAEGCREAQGEFRTLDLLWTLKSLYFIFLFLCLSLCPSLPAFSIPLTPKGHKSFFQGSIQELWAQLQRHVLAEHVIYKETLSYIKKLSHKKLCY